MKLRELPQGSPQAKRRDELLAIMRDETRPDEERIERQKLPRHGSHSASGGGDPPSSA
jgi:hypothetical protein